MPKQKPKNLPQNDRRISTEWFYGLDPSEHQQLEQVWRNSTYLTDRLKGILERRLKVLEIDKEDDYNNPQWSVVRADRNGVARAFREILRLLP